MTARRMRKGAALMNRWVALAIVACVLVPFLLVQLLASPSLPLELRDPSPISESSCRRTRKPLTLGIDAFCTGSCPHYGTCFPRVRTGMCISSRQVKLCQKPVDSTRMPPFLRFRGERLTVPVVEANCSRNKGKWVPGMSLVADQRLLPYAKPNPHHEAEKLIPATLFMHRFKPNSTELKLFWFSSPEEVSVWAQGFIEAMDMKDRVVYVDIPEDDDEPMCFEDAVLFSLVTNVRYVPDEDHNSWLRARVLNHCSIPIMNVSSTFEEVVILDRSGPRHIENVDEISQVLGNVLNVPVRTDFAGGGSFCEQVSKFAKNDFMVVPHGSQNVNLLFARPGSQVIEIFPYLFYNTALKNYTHSAQIRVHPLLGRPPASNALMRLFSFLGWDSCYGKVKFCKNYSRRQPIYADMGALQNLLNTLVDD